MGCILVRCVLNCFQMETILISPTQAAKLLNVTRQVVTKWCRQGKFKAWKVGNQWVIDRDSLEQYVAKKGDNDA